MTNGNLTKHLREMELISHEMVEKLGFSLLRIDEVNQELMRNARYFVQVFRNAHAGDRRAIAELIALVPTAELSAKLDRLAGSSVLADQLMLYYPLAEETKPALAGAICRALDEISDGKSLNSHIGALVAARKQFGAINPPSGWDNIIKKWYSSKT